MEAIMMNKHEMIGPDENPVDEDIDREYQARRAVSKIMQAMVGIDKLTAKIDELGLSPSAQAQATECLVHAKRDTEDVALDFIKAIPIRMPN
jgi:hypothetical protein